MDLKDDNWGTLVDNVGGDGEVQYHLLVGGDVNGTSSETSYLNKEKRIIPKLF